jgi:class 3 adenylate cyclase
MPTVDERYFDEKLAELEKLRAWSPRVVSKLESFLRTGDDWAVFRTNAYAFAAERGISEEEAVDLFLLAAKVGLVQMSWSLLCGGCGAAVESFSTLRHVSSVFHCALCAVDIETRLDDFVHVAFTVSPKVRTIPAHDPTRLPVEDYYYRYFYAREARMSPGGPCFADLMPENVVGLRWLEPRTTTTFDIEVIPGVLAVHDAVSDMHTAVRVDPAASGPNPKLQVALGARTRSAATVWAPGAAQVDVDNDTDRRLSIMLLMKPPEISPENAQGMFLERFLTGRRLLNSSTFRQAFGSETIQGAEGLGVRDVSILFTDLKGSTQMYDNIGDLKAFALVNQHFERLGRVISKNRGAVVKTIGDAVMASFDNASDAVLAGREMLQAIAAFNREGGEGKIVLKVGIHRGASIAVTLNDRLDYFGQTVNIAARVQALADADEIFVTDDVLSAPGVPDALRGLSLVSQEVQLKGVQRSVRVHRVGVV